eukprot:scaffold86723_cov57-Phaeocystis_antarctica.AAC.1
MQLDELHTTVQQRVDDLQKCSACVRYTGAYGVRSRRTRLLEDQLGGADAGSWQIADGGATRKAAAGGTSVGDYR